MARIVLLALMLVAAAPGQGEGFEGLPVVEIAFSPPAQPLSYERLLEMIPLRVGSALDADQVRESIRGMFATGRYADVRVDAVRAGEGVKLTFITTDNWFIGPVRVLGVKEPPSAGQLINVTKLELGELFTEQKMGAAKEALGRMLLENGFYRASIEVETQAHTDTQQIDITFQVTPGERARFGEITLKGKPELTAEQVRRTSGWSTGKRLSQAAVQRGLERLHRHYLQKGHLQATVGVMTRRFQPASNRVDLEVEIVPGPRIEVAISGTSLSRKQLRRYVPIYEEGVVDRDLLAEGVRNLRDHFQTRGYFDAKLDYDQHPEEKGQILVEFQALLGERHNFVKLEISGNRFFDTATIRERMYLQPRNLQFRRGRFSQSLLAGDIQAIEELYRTNGFLQVKVEPRAVDDYLGKNGDMAVFVSIVEGPQTLISSLEIVGNRSLGNETFAGKLSSVAGQPFSEAGVARDRDQILSSYFSEGFPDATLQWRATPAAEPNRVELEYSIQEGERQFINQVIIDGQEKTKEGLIRRQIQFSAGEPLSQAEMIESQRRLYNLGIFAKVDMAIQNEESRETLRNVLFQLEEARKWTVGVGGGAEIARIGGERTRLESPAGETGFSPRLTLEVSRLNMFGSAGTLSFRTRVSSLQQRGLVQYQVPQWRGRERLTLTFSSLYDTSRNVRTFTATRLEGALQLQHQISKPSTLFYRYSYRRVNVDEETLKISPALIPTLSQTVRVGLLSATFAQDRRDDPLDAKRGIYNTLDLGIAGNFTGSEASFFRVLAQNSTYHPLTRRLVFARTTQVGGLGVFGGLRRVEIAEPGGGSREEFTRAIPLPERFFSGGSNSHRGFPVNQAGPRDIGSGEKNPVTGFRQNPGTGFPLGGKGLFLNSVELRFPVRGENISGVLFHDAGNVYAKPRIGFRVRQRRKGQDPDYEDFDYMVHAVGVGVRYRTPIGPIRLDLAYSINPPHFLGLKGTLKELLELKALEPIPQRISRFQFHFSLGQTF